MIRKNINLDDISTETLDIGFVGEANHVEIAIHCAGFFKEYPDAAAMMTVAPPVGEMYPVQLDRDDQALIWEISEGDLAYAGAGTYQLTFTEDEEIIKTVYGSYSVSPSLVPTGDPPDPIENWIERAEEALAEFQQDVTTAEAWAAGTRDGEPVPSTDPAYENNSKYYAEEAAAVAASIPEDYSELSADVEEMKSSKAPVIINTASGDIATIPDGADGMPVKTLTVEIEPVQDLHGYDNPWPGGGWKNLFPPLTAETKNGVTLAISDGVITLNTASGGATADTYFDIEVSGVSVYEGDAIYLYAFNPSAGSSRLSLFAITSAGNPQINLNSVNASSSSNSSTDTTITKFRLRVPSGEELTNFKVSPYFQIGGTAPTSFSPYSNICPISGWTGANVTGTGKNLLNPGIKEYSNSNMYFGGHSLGNVPDGTFILPAGTYTASASATMSGIYTFDSSGSSLGLIYNNTKITFTNPKTQPFLIRFYKANTTEQDFSGINMWMEYGSTASTYEAYQGSKTEYEFPEAAGTVYGGTLTIHQDGSGELVVDHEELDLGTLSWITGFGGINATISGMKEATSTSDGTRLKCSAYQSVAFGSSSGVCITIIYGGAGYTYNGRLLVKDSRFSNMNDLVAAMDGVKLVYELATPVTYQLTNQQVIELLKGQNNIWADTGDVAVEYPADTKLYIDGKVAELQALILENISNS